ncbi:hypothetical protein FOZ63_007751, partial [Perkinsus olseni]
AVVLFGSEVSLSHGPEPAVPSSVLGLGFSQDGFLQWSLIDQLIRDSSGYIKSRSFSLYLEPGPFARGEVLLGGVDPDKFIGPLALMPVVGEGHWMLHLLAVYVGGASRRQAGLHAILDTGTNGIQMPAKAREDLITLIRFGLQKPIDIRLVEGKYEIDCADRKYLPTIELSFEGVGGTVSMEVPQENYVEEFDSSCTSLFLEDSEGFWRIGQNVIPGNYFSFDFDKKQTRGGCRGTDGTRAGVLSGPANGAVYFSFYKNYHEPLSLWLVDKRELDDQEDRALSVGVYSAPQAVLNLQR